MNGLHQLVDMPLTVVPALLRRQQSRLAAIGCQSIHTMPEGRKTFVVAGIVVSRICISG